MSSDENQDEKKSIWAEMAKAMNRSATIPMELTPEGEKAMARAIHGWTASHATTMTEYLELVEQFQMKQQLEQTRRQLEEQQYWSQILTEQPYRYVYQPPQHMGWGTVMYPVKEQPRPPRTVGTERVTGDPWIRGYGANNRPIWVQEDKGLNPGTVFMVGRHGTPREATPAEVIALSADPMVGVTMKQYIEAHNKIVEEARETFQQMGSRADLYLDDDVLRIMRKAEDDQTDRLNRGVLKSEDAKLDYLPYPGRIHQRSQPVGGDEWVAQLWPDANFSVRGKKGVTNPPGGQTNRPPALQPIPGSAQEKTQYPGAKAPRAKNPASKLLQNKKEKKEPVALTIAPGEEGFGLMGLTPEDVFPPVPGVNLLHQFRDDAATIVQRIVSDMRQTTAGEAAPLILFTPCVWEVKPHGARARKLNVDSWALVYMTWDHDLQLFLLSLPDGSDLEYVHTPSGGGEHWLKAFSNIVWLALGNALLSDEDREHIKTSGTGISRLIERYWKSQAKVESMAGLVAATVAVAAHQDQATGMERVR